MGIIEFQNVCYSYTENERALNDVSLSINQGEFVALIGHNGSGKSTMAKHMNALFVPSGGKVTVLDMDSADDENILPIREHAGMVFQNPDNQMVTTIVEEDVAFGPENLGVPTDEIRSRVDHALSVVNMSEFASFAPHKLSGGQKQRIAIAGVLAMHPDILIFDEATAMLDPNGRKEILETAIRLNKEENITLVLITHFMEEAAFADRIVVVSKGEVAMQGSPAEIFSRSKELEKIGLAVPFGVRLAQNIRDNGIPINDDILDQEALADAIASLILE